MSREGGGGGGEARGSTRMNRGSRLWWLPLGKATGGGGGWGWGLADHVGVRGSAGPGGTVRGEARRDDWAGGGRVHAPSDRWRGGYEALWPPAYAPHPPPPPPHPPPPPPHPPRCRGVAPSHVRRLLPRRPRPAIAAEARGCACHRRSCARRRGRRPPPRRRGLQPRRCVGWSGESARDLLGEGRGGGAGAGVEIAPSPKSSRSGVTVAAVPGWGHPPGPFAWVTAWHTPPLRRPSDRFAGADLLPQMGASGLHRRPRPP